MASTMENVNADGNRDLYLALFVDHLSLPILALNSQSHISSSRFQYALLGEKMSEFVSSLLCRSPLLFIFWSEWIFSGT